MFIGEYRHSLDEKGRIIVPSRFRDKLDGRFVLTKGLDTCLFGFTLQEWQEQEKRLAALPMTLSDGRAFARMFFSGASECEIDKQGRTLIPASLREYARINRDIVIVGVASRFEIWAIDVWNDYSSRVQDSYEAIAEKLVSFGQL